MPAPGTISATRSPPRTSTASPRATRTPTQSTSTTGGVARKARPAAPSYHVAGRHPGDQQGRQRAGLCRLLHAPGSPIPQIQEPPFRPLHHREGQPEAAPTALRRGSAGKLPATRRRREATDAVLSTGQGRVRGDAHRAATRTCRAATRTRPSRKPTRSPIHYASDTDEQPERQARLFRFYLLAPAPTMRATSTTCTTRSTGCAAAVRRRPNSTSATRTTIPKARSRAITIIGYRTDGPAGELRLRRGDQVDHLAQQMARRRRRVVSRAHGCSATATSRWSSTRSTRPMTARSIRETVLDYDTAP